MILVAVNLIERFFSSAAIVLLLVASILYITTGRKKEEIQDKMLMYGFSSYFGSVALTRIFLYFIEISVDGTYSGDIASILNSYNTGNIIILYFYLYFFIYTLVNTLFLTVVFIWYSIDAKKQLQTVSSTISIGFTLIVIGWIFESFFIRRIALIPHFLPPIFIMIGILIVSLPLIIDLDFFSNKIANWLVFILIIITVGFLGLSFTNLPQNVLSVIIIGISAFVLILVGVYLVKHIIEKTREEHVPSNAKNEVEDFLNIFTKPTSIAVDEIELSREKGICLVCKGKISRLNYACPKCNVLYCEKCAKALTKIENSCWVCETPFEESESIKVN